MSRPSSSSARVRRTASPRDRLRRRLSGSVTALLPSARLGPASPSGETETDRLDAICPVVSRPGLAWACICAGNLCFASVARRWYSLPSCSRNWRSCARSMPISSSRARDRLRFCAGLLPRDCSGSERAAMPEEDPRRSYWLGEDSSEKSDLRTVPQSAEGVRPRRAVEVEAARGVALDVKLSGRSSRGAPSASSLALPTEAPLLCTDGAGVASGAPRPMAPYLEADNLDSTVMIFAEPADMASAPER